MREKGPAPWGSKGPRLVPIGGIGINGVETNHLIMTESVDKRERPRKNIFLSIYMAL